ncbi:hypothetical protein Pan14r_51170 [Crateriforma conspicua]|uniref:Uncharacterized protein n=1 Tax=Crateriforma conspicua TaxID=2527996 RepID=A0A5C5XRU7_9PLAN|nr:hypothetical protein Pan14r_51170 [Crateriforma conspicua]
MNLNTAETTRSLLHPPTGRVEPERGEGRVILHTLPGILSLNPGLPTEHEGESKHRSARSRRVAVPNVRTRG